MSADNEALPQTIVISRGTIVWLEDDPDDDRILARVVALRRIGFEVVLARGFRELDQKLRERLQTQASADGSSHVSAIVIDIMIEGVENLSRYFPWVLDAKASRGYAAGLVFLERVFAPERRSEKDGVFGHFDAVPIVVYSIRAVSEEERDRIQQLRKRRSGHIDLLVKSASDEFVRCIERLVPGRPKGGR